MAFKLNITVLKDGEVYPAGTEFHGDNKPAFLEDMIKQGHAFEIPELVIADAIVIEDEDKPIEELEGDEDGSAEGEEETPMLKKRGK